MVNISTVNELSELFAANAHEQWRRGFDEEYARSGVKSKERIKSNSDGSQGDIHVDFKSLHDDWKKENLCAGSAALMAILNNSSLMLGDADAMERAAEEVHLAWMDRNAKSTYNAHQHVSYEELNEIEREKDREQIKQMIFVLKNVKNISTPEDVRLFLKLKSNQKVELLVDDGEKIYKSKKSKYK